MRRIGPRNRSSSGRLAWWIGVVVGSAVLAAPRPALAATTFTSPSVGVTPGQVARLTVVNNGTIAETETMTILGPMGEMLATRTVSIDPGHRASVDFMTANARLEVHGKITPCPFPADLQVFDSSTGQSLVLVENFIAPTPASSDLTSPSLGLAAGQMARLSFVNIESTTVTQTLEIANGMGEVVASASVMIGPGRVGTLDYMATAPRMEIHAVLGIPPCNFPADLQVFDADTMRTTALVEMFRESPTKVGTLTSPSVGLANGQTARVVVVNNGTTTETETLSIVNGAGATLATRTVSIAPGRIGTVQVAGGASRTEVHGMIGGVAPLCNFPADLQVFDAGTMRTTALVEVFRESPT